MKIPENVASAIDSLLKPCGIDFKDLLERNKKINESDEQRYLSIAEAENLTGIGRWTLARAIKSGKVKASKLSQAKSGKVLINKNSLVNWIESCATNKYQRKK